jgi:hypothetical protein
MMGTVWVVIFNILYMGALIAVNWILWFILLPKIFRHMRDQFRQSRDRKNSASE